MGYVEVQNPYSNLQRLFSVPDKEDISVLAVMSTGDVFFSSRVMDASLASYYSTLARSLKTSVSLTRNSVTGQDEIVTGSSSEYMGIAVLLAQNKNALRGFVRDGRWLVEMTDNGQGFDPLLLRALRERMATVRKEASHQGTRTGMAIGGMGIVAT